jgi:hypothetical protein
MIIWDDLVGQAWRSSGLHYAAVGDETEPARAIMRKVIALFDEYRSD